jgi:glycosyltransferase involved in cell wall biosynthesis
MKITLIFDPDISGHHREYINHLYLGAGKKVDEKFVFAVHPELKDVNGHLNWPSFPNVVIDYLDKKQIVSLNGCILKSSYTRSKLLNQYVCRHNPSNVFLDSIISYLPFIVIVLDHNIKVSGIVFNIFTRSYKNHGCLRRILDYWKYSIFSRCRLFDRIFLLNDSPSARLLCKKFGSPKFHYLPDPVNIISGTINHLPEEYDRPVGKKVFLHFGALSERKGTVDILRSLELINDSLLDKACFVFAGMINDDIRSEFIRLTEELSKKVHIIVYKGYSSYELLGSLCSGADYLLLPYRSGSNSSGLLGYSAQYNLPVIAASHGLLGYLINKYKLGYSYNLKELKNLSEALRIHIKEPVVQIDGSYYLVANSIRNFQETVLN